MRTETASYQTADLRHQRFFSIGAEVFLTLLSCALLAYLARSLSLPSLDGGLGHRYGTYSGAESLEQLWATTHDLFSRLGNDQRATLLLRTAPVWLPAFGLVGLGLTYCARSAGGWGTGLVVLVWSSVAMVWRPFGWPVSMGAAGALMGLCLLLRVARKTTGATQNANTFRPGSITMWNSLVWPGWVLLTGLGWLWIADFAARGPVAPIRPGAKYFGLHQADALFLAYGIVLLAAAKSTSVVQGLARVVTGLALTWRRPRGPRMLLIAAALLAIALGWLGHRNNSPLPLLAVAGGGMPHVSGELFRLVAGIALSWAAYRFGEWGASGSRLWRGLAWTAGVGVLCLLGLGVSGDMGPVLILSLTLLMFLSVPAVKLASHIISASSARSRATLGMVMLGVAVIVVAGIWLWRTALTEWAPQLSRTAALREAARQNPFGANSPNLAQAHWLMDAASNVGGFGLGRVPYCGANAHIGETACTLGSGAPIQLPSDFAFAGLAATWGMSGAAACIALLFVWLRALVFSAMPPRQSTGSFELGLPAQDDPLSWLRAWLVAVPCLMSQAQILVSVGGTLAWTPLTGVTLPLLGYGTAALCVSAVWVGLAARPISDWAAVHPKHSHPN